MYIYIYIYICGAGRRAAVGPRPGGQRAAGSKRRAASGRRRTADASWCSDGWRAAGGGRRYTYMYKICTHIHIYIYTCITIYAWCPASLRPNGVFSYDAYVLSLDVIPCLKAIDPSAFCNILGMV